MVRDGTACRSEHQQRDRRDFRDADQFGSGVCYGSPLRFRRTEHPSDLLATDRFAPYNQHHFVARGESSTSLQRNGFGHWRHDALHLVRHGTAGRLEHQQRDGLISGTPTSSETASVTVLLSDSGGQNIQAPYSLQIASVLTISTTSLPAGRVQQAYSATVSATGGTTPYTWSATGLPAGLSINSGTGLISGTPTSSGTASVTVLLSDSGGQNIQAPYSLQIASVLTISTTSLPAGRVQQSYSATVSANGGTTPYTWSATGLPAGLSINSGTGLISGTPTSSGAASVTVLLSDSGGQNAQLPYPLQIASVLTISTTSLPAGRVQQAYSATVSATGGTTPYTWSATGLPAGLSINSGTGLISGTPTSSGTASVTVLLSDSGGQNIQAPYSLQIASVLTISTTSLPAGRVQQSYSATVSANGGTTPYTWSATGLPAGLSINSGTGLISGTPTSSGVASVTVLLSDSGGQSAQLPYALQIASVLTIGTTSLPAGRVQQAYAATVSATGGTTPYIWSATGLPAGVSINSGSGLISGTPTNSGSFSATILLSDAGGQSNQAIYPLQIVSLFSITTSPYPRGEFNKPTAQRFQPLEERRRTPGRQPDCRPD